MEVFETIFPIVAIALAGYLVARQGYFNAKECDALSKFVFSCLIPSLLFISTAKAQIPENMPWGFLGAYYIGALGIYLLAVVMGKILFGYTAAEQSVFGMGSAYSNATIIGIPICTYALGGASLLPLLIIISVHNIVLFTIGTMIAERDSLTLSSWWADSSALLKQLFTNPITGSLIAGAAINYLDFSIYPPVAESLTLLGSAAVPAALFVLGMSLVRYHVRGHVGAALVMVALKMILFPLVVWLLVFRISSVDPLWASIALLTSAMPVGVSAYIFSKKYQACEAVVATATIFSTLGSVLTLGALLKYVQTVI